MNYVESFNLLGIEAKQIPCIKGEGAPTEATEGAVGCLYMDIDTGDIYKCTSVSETVFTWVLIGDGGSGGITVEQEVNESENPVSSKAVYNEFVKFGNDCEETIEEKIKDSSEIQNIKTKTEILSNTLNTENIYDEANNSSLSGTEFRIGTVELSGTEEFVTISTKGGQAAYITNILLYDNNNTQIPDVTISNNFYNVGLTRQGKCVTIPENARKLTFKYRFLHASSGTTLCSEMMVSIGKTVPLYYSEYECLNIIKNSPYLTEKDINRIYYVSTAGNNNNDGFTKETALASVYKAIELGAREIAVEAGEYFSEITLRDLKNIHIYTYRNNEEYSHAASSREMAKFIGATYYNNYTINSDGIYQQENVQGGTYYSEVFVNKTKAPGSIISHYNAYLMVIHDISSKNYYLKPVVTYNECITTDNSFYWDGSTLFFNTTSLDFTKIAVVNGAGTLHIYACDTVTIDDICCEFGYSFGFEIRNSNNIILNNCQGNYSPAGMGFSINNTNAVLNNCYATKNSIDGFNFHEYGTTILNDCVAENNYDDGCSHHSGCVGTINGGRFSGSGKAGIAPAYGANVNIYNATCENNPVGIGYLTTNNGHANMKGIVAGCLLKNNRIGLQVEPLATVTSMGCEYVDNTTDKYITGTLITDNNDIEMALDTIIAIQNSLIGGDA